MASEFVEVSIAEGKTLLVSKFETSVAQWRACVADNSCPQITQPEGGDYLPVTGVNWQDTFQFLTWYAIKSGQEVRLPSKEEWELIAAEHAPTSSPKLFSDPRMSWAASYDLNAEPKGAPVRTLGANGYNRNEVADIKGNVWEWTANCEPMIEELQTASSPCYLGRVAMGEHYAVVSDLIRDPAKVSCSGGQPPTNIGFRMVIDF